MTVREKRETKKRKMSESTKETGCISHFNTFLFKTPPETIYVFPNQTRFKVLNQAKQYELDLGSDLHSSKDCGKLKKEKKKIAA